MVTRLIALLRTFLRSNAAIYLAGSVLGRIGAVALIPLYTRRLTPTEYGEYAIFVSLLAVLPNLFSVGLTAGLSRVFFTEQDISVGTRRLGSVARGMFLVVLVLSGVSALGVSSAHFGSLFGLRRAFWLLAILTGAGQAFGMVPDHFFRATQRPRPAVALQLISFFSMSLLGVFFVLGLGKGVTGVVEAATGSALLMATISITFVLFRLPGRFSVGATADALRFSVAFVPHAFSGWIQMTADRWVLDAFGAHAALGTYYLAVQLLSPIQMICSAWNDAQAPKIGELFRTAGAEGSYRALGSFYRSYGLVTFAPAAALLVGSPLIPLMIGPKFLGALAVMPVLGAAYVADAFYYPATNFLFYVGRTNFIPVVSVVSAIFSIGLAILLLPRFGLMGLVASRLLASIIRAGAMAFAAWYVRPPSLAATP